MNRSKWIGVVAAVALVTFLALSYAGGVPAQQPGAKRTVLAKQDLSGIPGREGIMVITEIPAGGKEPRHTHPGDIFVYALEGTMVLTREGQPTVTVKAGDSFVVTAGTVHTGENVGKTPVKLLVTFVVEKGKPLATTVQ
jgi:quercetin dioxygenase-like cupin family protein